MWYMGWQSKSAPMGQRNGAQGASATALPTGRSMSVTHMGALQHGMHTACQHIRGSCSCEADGSAQTVKFCENLYRANWEPATTSGKCMAGVPGVFWRSPAVLQGPCTHNPTLVAGKTHTSKNWPIFPICMWKWGGSAPSGQARVSRPNWPQCAKSHAAWQSLSSRAEKLRIFSKIVFSFLTIFFGFLVIFCRFLAVCHILRLACFLAVLAAPG